MNTTEKDEGNDYQINWKNFLKNKGFNENLFFLSEKNTVLSPKALLDEKNEIPLINSERYVNVQTNSMKFLVCAGHNNTSKYFYFENGIFHAVSNRNDQQHYSKYYLGSTNVMYCGVYFAQKTFGIENNVQCKGVFSDENILKNNNFQGLIDVREYDNSSKKSKMNEIIVGIFGSFRIKIMGILHSQSALEGLKLFDFKNISFNKENPEKNELKLKELFEQYFAKIALLFCQTQLFESFFEPFIVFEEKNANNLINYYKDNQTEKKNGIFKSFLNLDAELVCKTHFQILKDLFQKIKLNKDSKDFDIIKCFQSFRREKNRSKYMKKVWEDSYYLIFDYVRESFENSFMKGNAEEDISEPVLSLVGCPADCKFWITDRKYKPSGSIILETKIDQNTKRIISIEKNVEMIEKNVERIDKKVEMIEKNVERIDKKVEMIEKNVGKILKMLKKPESKDQSGNKDESKSNKEYLQWTKNDIKEWIDDIGGSEEWKKKNYGQKFFDDEENGNTIKEIKMNDLKEMEIKIRKDRNIIFNAIENLKRN